VTYEVVFSPEAQNQIDELHAYLADRFYPGNADRYVARLIKTCSSLGLAPHRGARREDLGAGVRMIGFEHRIDIYFRVTEAQVIIAGVLYGGQMPTSLG